MRWVCVLGVCAALLASCAHKPATASANKVAPKGKAGNSSPLIVTPGGTLSGRLASVNPGSRFVIVTFPVGMMPMIEQRMNVYREGLKVGVIKITGPQRDNNIAADIVAGDCRPGDEVKSE